jgi:hypothetical protein
MSMNSEHTNRDCSVFLANFFIFSSLKKLYDQFVYLDATYEALAFLIAVKKLANKRKNAQ